MNMSATDEELPWLPRLYDAFRDHQGQRPYKEVLQPWIPRVRRILSVLEPFSVLNTATNPYAVTDESLWQWYALSRLNDLLLKSFESGDQLARRFAEPSAWRGPIVTPDEYLSFSEELGFTSFLVGRNDTIAPEPFHPFLHEIVEVVEDATLSDAVAVAEYAFWPGLRFGQMMFSRAGVRVRCRRGDLNKQIAESSRLYFTYWRLWRETEDLSHGWGHNSQWRTKFRRDYDIGDAFHYNVDGEHLIGDEDSYRASFTPDDWEFEESHPDHLTMEERIELLTHRCFVRCAKPPENQSPFSDRYVEFKNETHEVREP